MRLSRFGLLFVLVLSYGVKAQAELIYGLTNFQQLVTFESTGSTRPILTTTALPGFSILGEFLIGIDVRPATGQLYGLSSLNNLYTINPATGVSKRIGTTPIAGLSGNAKALDFNPTVDRIRVLSSNGENLRVHPDTGAIAFTDTPLQFAAGDANAGDTPRVVNGAYTNSIAGATTTTLYDLDSLNDVLVTQNPPNNGTLNTVGLLGFDLVDSGGFNGFDISGATGLAYLVGNNNFGAGLAVNILYSVNLTTGAATSLGPVTGIGGSFRDIAVVGPAAIPEPSLVISGIGCAALLVWRYRRRSLAI